jgi:hypothetical protein
MGSHENEGQKKNKQKNTLCNDILLTIRHTRKHTITSLVLSFKKAERHRTAGYEIGTSL